MVNDGIVKQDSFHRRVRYHLRFQVLPSHSAREEAAFWRILKTAKVDEVIFIVPHQEDLSPGLGTRAECERAIGRLKPLFTKLRKRGITPSINVWWTLGFGNFPNNIRNLHSRFSFRWAVAADGRPSLSVACPRDEVWRKHVCWMYARFASLSPTRLWVDDDTCATLRGDVATPCFCESCLAEINRRTGRVRSRKELLRAILKNPPNRIRESWLEFQDQIVRDIFRDLSAAVHKVSPKTHMGIMCSVLETHNAEGRNWPELFKAMGEPVPYARPHLGPYTQSTPETFAGGFNSTFLAQSFWPARIPIAPEIDHWPHTRFVKSARCMFVQMALAQLVGIPEITLSINRYAGRPDLERDHVWEKMLGQSKPYYQAIANLSIKRHQIQGIGLFFHDRICRHTRPSPRASLPRHLKHPRAWDELLPLLGMAISHSSREVMALSGEQVYCMDQRKLDDIFSRGVLLDAGAVENMIRLGQGDLVGVLQRTHNARASIETLEDQRFGQQPGDPINLRTAGSAWQFLWNKSAREISSLRGYCGERTGHGVMLFENHLGGRVAVIPFDAREKGFTTPSYLNWTRRAQLVDTLEWLGRIPLPLVIHDAPMVFPILVHQPGRLIVGVANLHSDPIDSLQFTIRKPAFKIRKIHYLGPDGSWKRLRAAMQDTGSGSHHVNTRQPVGHLQTAVFRLE